MRNPSGASIRIEGGARICAHCNRTLTFDMMRDGVADCDCDAARAEIQAAKDGTP